MYVDMSQNFHLVSLLKIDLIAFAVMRNGFHTSGNVLSKGQDLLDPGECVCDFREAVGVHTFVTCPLWCLWWWFQPNAGDSNYCVP